MNAQSGADSFDVVVAGGGMVGTTLALALAQGGARVAVMDASVGGAGHSAPRPIALAYGSRRVLEGLGVWAAIGESATPIDMVHVSDRGRFGVTRLRAADYGVDALGYVSEAARIGAALDGALECEAGIRVYRPWAVRRLDVQDQGIRVVGAPSGAGSGAHALEAKLLVAADGGQSTVRDLCGIPVREYDWRQSAVTATVESRLDHANVAFERFTAKGPVALLPVGPHQSGLVWSMPNGEAGVLSALDDGEFLRALGDVFGTRLGEFSACTPRTRHKLVSSYSTMAVKPRVALAGNAANHLHPVAGQGLNLGLRDAAILAETVVDALRRGQDPGALTTLESYARWRRRDQRSTASFTEGLVRLFSNDFLPVALLRDAGLVGLDSLGFLKRGLAQRAMGLSGRSSRLARGLPL